MPTFINLPALSPGMTEGKLLRWTKRAGDRVERGEVIAEIETDKSVLELEAIESGRLVRILVPEGTGGIPTDAPLAVLAKPGEDESIVGASTALPLPERTAASPLARRMAAAAGIDLKSIAGTGPRGRIVAADIERVRDAQPEDPYTSVENSNAHRIMAQRLTEAASSIPHFYLTIDCEVDALAELRQRLNRQQAAEHKITINDFIIRACALASRKVPRVNASWSEEAIRLHRDVDIAVAAAGPDSLMTPIVRKADTKSLATIAAEMRELVARARARKLRPDEFQGGGFAISNLGMYGIREFTSIINPPHAAILAVGAAQARPVVRAGELAVATVITCTLSCDHRVLDGATGAEFLNCFRELIEVPDRLM